MCRRPKLTENEASIYEGISRVMLPWQMNLRSGRVSLQMSVMAPGSDVWKYNYLSGIEKGNKARYRRWKRHRPGGGGACAQVIVKIEALK